jgi:hypothetical protein
MTHRSGLFGLAALALALSIAAYPAHASVTLTDTTFDLSGYAMVTYKSDAASTFTATQCPSCGNNTPEGLSIATSLPNGGGLTLGFINTGFVYDPTSQGEIDSLFAFVSKDLTSLIAATSGNTFRPLIEQGGIYYMATLNGENVVGPTTTGFRDIFGMLTAASFSRYDFTTGGFLAGNPSFSTGEMRFGLAQLTIGAPPGHTGSIRYDTLRFDITSTPPAAAVPEPATWMMMIAGFGLAGVSLRRRRSALV